MASSNLCRLLLLLLTLHNIHTGAVSPERYAQPALNVATQGIASQSSTNSYLGIARNANDGSLANNYLRAQCSYTKKDHEPYWMVDLRTLHRVLSVAVTNRVLDCCRERLFEAEIRIGNNPSQGGKLNPRCGVISSIESGETLSFSCQGMVGKYVSINIPGREENLILCEVQVYGVPIGSQDEVTEPKDLKTTNGAPNVALKGVSQQSSLLNMYGESKNAIDGSLGSNFFNIECTSTKEQTDPWWMVDLKEEFKVFTVTVTNRGDCCAEKINGAQVRIGNSAEDGGTKNPICGVISSMPNGRTMAFQCDGMVGRYVTVFIPGANRSLSICEVQVFGLPSSDSVEQSVSPPFFDPFEDLSFLFDSEEHEQEEFPGKEEVADEGENIAFRGITSQSSTYDNLGASKNAIDGSSSTRYMSRHCAHTDLDLNPWWMVDLTKIYIISKVVILNRGDCCNERLNGAQIRIGDDPKNGGTRNFICATISSLGLGKEQEFQCGIVGRYITLTVQGRLEYLTVCEVKAYGTAIPDNSYVINPEPDSSEIRKLEAEEKKLEQQQRELEQRKQQQSPNVALDGMATQSSTDGGNASNAIDSSMSTCTQTKKEEDPSWMLDLKSIHRVNSIAVTSSKDSAPEDLNGAVIMVLNPAPKGTTSKICGTVSSIGSGETFSFNCHGMEGQYITIRNPGKERVLSLCNVQVFARPVGSPGGDWTGDLELQKQYHGVKNVALQGIAYESSHFGQRHSAKKAIDGSLGSYYTLGQCSHTRYEKNPSWMVDLKAEYRIQSVALTNRGDCCRERMNSAEVHIGNSMKDFGRRNPICGKVIKMNYGETLSFNCNGMEGQYVSVIITNQTQYLTLCEVQVFGEPVAQTDVLDPRPTKVLPTAIDPPPTGKHTSEEESDKSRDLTGKYFHFPQASDNSYVVLSPEMPLNLGAFTLCMKLSPNFTENRETILFSYRTTYYDEINIWQEDSGKVGVYLSGDNAMFPKLDRSKDWTHFCLAWESKQGRCELWVNGRRTDRTIIHKYQNISPGGIVILGQDQDGLGRDFDENQSFVGKIKDVNMWNKLLSLKSLKSVMKGHIKQKGNIFDWSNLHFSIKGNVHLV